ncbi:MAG: hypothetical protein PHD15_06205 [Clostridia bacterium]|nr:hypothetical protein [Clostridia bacterium]MDD4387322.1 hypothetical protein [Clostridia bacterium]
MSFESMYEKYQEKNEYVELLGIKEGEIKCSYISISSEITVAEDDQVCCKIDTKTHATVYIKDMNGVYYATVANKTTLSELCTLISRLRSMGYENIIVTHEKVTIECKGSMYYQQIFDSFSEAIKKISSN